MKKTRPTDTQILAMVSDPHYAWHYEVQLRAEAKARGLAVNSTSYLHEVITALKASCK